MAKKAGLESSVNSAENMLEKIVKLPHTKEDKFKFVVCHLVRRVLNLSYHNESFQYLYEWD